jgi:hypothetical protein
LILALATTVTAQAKLSDYFDVEKFLTGALMISESINESLEQLRQQQHAKVDLAQQWDLMCQVADHMKNNLEFANNMLTGYNLGQPACIPLSNALKLQANVLSACRDFYNKEVQINFDNVFSDLMTSISDSQQIMSQCYPWVADFGL